MAGRIAIRYRLPFLLSGEQGMGIEFAGMSSVPIMRN